MEIISLIFDYFLLAIASLIGFIVFLVVIAILFGKKQEEQYDLEAEFVDENNREYAEFDLRSWRYAKEQGDFQLDVSFHWKDERLTTGDKVQVSLENSVILEGNVSDAGKIRLNKDNLINQPNNPKAGKICTVMLNGDKVLEQAMERD